MLAFALLVGAGTVLPQLLLAAVCHELGHLAALRAVGVKVEAFRLNALGAELRADTRYLSYGREILCTLAGPVVNLFLAVLLSRCFGAYLMAGAHLLLGLYNLLPLPTLDGGRTLLLLLSWRFGPYAAERVCQVIGFTVGGLLTAAALILVLRYRTGLFLLLAALGCLWQAVQGGCQAKLPSVQAKKHEESAVP